MATTSPFLEASSHLPESLSSGDRLADSIRSAIAIGSIDIGDRLPSEVALASDFGVAVATLRKSLATLREQGIVETRRGREGGTFVTQVPFPSDAQVRQYLASLTIIGLRDYSDEHCTLAAGTVRLVAQRALDRDLDELFKYAQFREDDQTISGQASWDNRFYVQLGAKSQSQRLMRSMMRLQSEIGALKWSPVAAGTTAEQAYYQRLEILESLRSRNADRADSTISNHIRQTTYRIIDVKLSLNQAGVSGGTE